MEVINVYNEEENKMIVNPNKKTDSEPDKLAFMDDIKSIIQQSMKKKGVSAKEVSRTLGIKRYEEK